MYTHNLLHAILYYYLVEMINLNGRMNFKLQQKHVSQIFISMFSHTNLRR